LNFFAFVDDCQIQLLIYVAANLDRVPRVSSSDVDVYALGESVSNLSAETESLANKG